MPSPLDTADLRRRVQACLDAELARQAGVLAELGPDVEDLLSAVADLLRGGKRLRAAFLYWGHRAAGRPDSEALVRLASAMELFQAAALIDDVMDDSDTRRGRPAAHRALATRHAERGWAGDGDRFGLAGAVLAGNLCLTWTDEVYATSGLAAEDLARGREVFDRMRTQLMAGQFLDVVESMRPWEGRPSRASSARAGHPLQEREVQRRAPPAHRRDDGRARRRGPRRAVALRPRPRPRLPAARRPARRLRRPRADRQAGGRRPARGQAHGAPRPRARRVRRRGPRPVETLVGRPDLDGPQVDELREIIEGSGAVGVLEDEIGRLAAGARTAREARRSTRTPRALVDSSTSRRPAA